MLYKTPEARRAQQRAYDASPEGKAKRDAYHATPEFKARNLARALAFNASPEGKAKHASPEFKTWKAAYNRAAHAKRPKRSKPI